MGVLASANLAFAGFAKVVDVKTVTDVYQQVMHFLIPLGQIGVAAATIYYILRKARAVTPVEVKRERRKRK